MDDEPDSVDLEPVRLDKPVEYAARVQKLGFREGLIVAGGLIVILAGAGVVAVNPLGANATAPPSQLAARPTAPPPTPVATATLGPSPSPSPGSSPTRTPAATPAGTCSTAPRVTPPPVVLLSQGVQTPGAMVSPDWQRGPADLLTSNDIGAAVTVPPDQSFVLSVDYQACALAWRIAFDDVVVQQQTNPGMDPAYARNGYFTVVPPVLFNGSSVLQLDLRYPSGWTTELWLVSSFPAPIPEAFVVAGEGSVDATPGCGLTVQLENGVTATTSCDGFDLGSLGANTLYTQPGTLLTFRVAQGGFTGASTGAVACGQIESTSGVKGDPSAFVVDPSCEVSAAISPAQDLTFRAPEASGVWTIAIDGCATQTAGSACGEWFVTIDTADPQPTSGIGD